MFMEPSKKGISKEEYQAAQQKRFDEDFVYNTNVKMQSLDRKLEELLGVVEENHATQGSDKKCCDIQISQVMEATMLSLKEFRQELSNFQKEINEMQSQVRVFKQTLSECVKLSHFNEKFSLAAQMFQKLEGERDSIRKDFTQVLNRFTQEVDNKLKVNKEEILSIPSELPHLKKMLDQRIELVELNGQNAVLRSSNNERQILLVERKIENIYQLVKKLDITNQESR